MISDRAQGVKSLVLLCQCGLVTLAFWVWFFLCYDRPIDATQIKLYLVYNLFILLGLAVEARSLPAELNLHFPAFEESARRTVRQVGVTLFYLLLFLVAERSTNISRVFFFSFIPVLFLILMVTNRLLPRKLADSCYLSKARQQVILLGPVAKASQLYEWFKGNEQFGMEVRGVLAEEAVEHLPSGLKLLGTPGDLEKVLGDPGVTEVIITEFPRNGSVRHYTEICEARGCRVLVVPDMDEIFGRPVMVFQDREKFFLGLREEPLENPINRFFKRCLDIAISLPVVVIMLPFLMLFVWICQRRQSPGPLFYLQPRDGINNRLFNIVKFRSMHVRDASDVRLPTAKDDPRLYPVGSFLRRTSLDEFPQFWNVLCGSMSVVGPRPHLKSYNEQYRKVYFRAYVRALVKPGITGLAQARGFRGDAQTSAEVASRIESDIEYLEKWSFWLDVWLIIRTALQVVVPPKKAV